MKKIMNPSKSAEKAIIKALIKEICDHYEARIDDPECHRNDEALEVEVIDETGRYWWATTKADAEWCQRWMGEVYGDEVYYEDYLGYGGDFTLDLTVNEIYTEDDTYDGYYADEETTRRIFDEARDIATLKLNDYEPSNNYRYDCY